MITELTQKCVEENAASTLSQGEYTVRYNGYVEQYNTSKARVEPLERERALRLAPENAFDGFIKAFKSIDSNLVNIDERVWQLTFESATVFHDGRIVFRFFNEQKLKDKSARNFTEELHTKLPPSWKVEKPPCY